MRSSRKIRVSIPRKPVNITGVGSRSILNRTAFIPEAGLKTDGVSPNLVAELTEWTKVPAFHAN
jgi:hypothetical protein